jgi:hypothetical protein
VLRRLVALGLALCFGLFSVEALLADVHDGDATHAELVSTGAIIGHFDVPGDHGSDHAPGRSGHATHACHCVHAHNGVPPVATELAPLAVRTSDVVGASERTPRSLVPEPRARPPVA